MPQYAAMLLGKWGFLLDIVQVIFGSTVALVGLGVVFSIFIIILIIGKVTNA